MSEKELAKEAVERTEIDENEIDNVSGGLPLLLRVEDEPANQDILSREKITYY